MQSSGHTSHMKLYFSLSGQMGYNQCWYKKRGVILLVFCCYLIPHFIMKLSVIAGALLIASVANAKPFYYEEQDSNVMAPLYVPPETEVVHDSYIVVLKNNLNDQRVEEHAQWISTLVQEKTSSFNDWLYPHTQSHGIRHVYDTPHLKGYAGRFDESILNAIRQSDDVSLALMTQNKKTYVSFFFRSNSSKRIPWSMLMNYNETLPGDLLVYLMWTL